MGHYNGRDNIEYKNSVKDKQYDSIVRAVEKCFFPDYMFSVRKLDDAGALIHAVYFEPDVTNPNPHLPQAQETREWFVPLTASKSEVVRTCFKLVMASYEHRVREHFLYKGKAIHQPHYDVDQLAAMNEERAD